jgi:uncharacterized membrane protein YebE (DUF533 family)
MIDAKRLLDQFLGAGQGTGQGSGPDRQDWQPAAGGVPGGVGGALGSIQDYARQNPMLAGALAGGLASVLMGSKGVRKLAGNALGYGGAAVIGGLAYKAYRDYQAGKAATGPVPGHPARSAGGVPAVLPPPADSPFAIANAAQGADVFALGLVTAMIAAAKADGHVDADERQRILGKLSENGLSAEEEAFLAKELGQPLDIDRIVALAKTKEQTIEIYAASLVAISPDHPAERAYLDMLAARLGLEPELARSVEQTVAGATAT